MLHRPESAPVAILITVLAGGFAGIATAQSTDDAGQSNMAIVGQTLPAETLRESRFRFLDLNGDDFLTRDEIGEEQIVLRSQFASLDWNNDGKLSRAEYVLNGRPE